MSLFVKYENILQFSWSKYMYLHTLTLIIAGPKPHRVNIEKTIKKRHVMGNELGTTRFSLDLEKYDFKSCSKVNCGGSIEAKEPQLARLY